MKKLFVMLSVLVGSVSAQASHMGEYDSNAISLVNVLMLCPKEVAVMMGQPNTTVVSARYVGGQLPGGEISTQYTIGFVQRLPAPSFSETVTTLAILERVSNNLTNAPDAPGKVVSVECKMSTKSVEE